MKCDDFISAYETGSALRRLRARLHARRCPKCAATRDWLCQVRSGLIETAELTPFHRRVWERAAVDDGPRPVLRSAVAPRWAIAGGATLAAVVVIAIVLSLPRKSGLNHGNIAVKSQPPSGSAIVTSPLQVAASEIAEIQVGLDQLAKDLDHLAEEAARLEARRALSELAALHPPLNSGDST
jgi:hypothetical protein